MVDRAMKTFNGWTGLSPQDRGASAAIGNFDGVHLGHQHVINIARVKAEETLAPLGIVTFAPHPREYFAPKAPAFRLMNAEARANRLEKLGVERLYQLPFNDILASLTPEQFAGNVLADGLGLSHLAVGADFHFGKDRAGTAQDLKALGERFGFDVTIAELIENDLGEVSSTAIRTALGEGRPRHAAEMLGHWHRIEGEVFDGDKRGRELGFPTANMSIEGLHPPRFGIYAVKVDVLTGPLKGEYIGASSIGVRPTFDKTVPILETFIFDFSGDLYGEHLSVAFIEYLRPEAKFDGIDSLIDQMNKDCQQARDILAKL